MIHIVENLNIKASWCAVLYVSLLTIISTRFQRTSRIPTMASDFCEPLDENEIVAIRLFFDHELRLG